MKCGDGTVIPQGQLKMWLDAPSQDASDQTINDIDIDGVPDYKLKAVIQDGVMLGYTQNKNAPCDSCAPYVNYCKGPEDGDPQHHACYNPSQKKDICQ
jgi:hypothetical protein